MSTASYVSNREVHLEDKVCEASRQRSMTVIYARQTRIPRHYRSKSCQSANREQCDPDLIHAVNTRPGNLLALIQPSRNCPPGDLHRVGPGADYTLYVVTGPRAPAHYILTYPVAAKLTADVAAD